jgi:hypothetical protein
MAMLTFQYRMTNPEEISYLQCKICKKEFPKYDQRGFRNAGFTAHQNRCIEREYLLRKSTVEHPPPPHKRRLLLPAPSPPRDSTMASNSSSYYTPYSNNQQQQHNQSEPFAFVSASALDIDFSLFSNVGHHSIDTFDLNITYSTQYISERHFPITQCDYCAPEHGLHQPSCLLLADIVSQAPSDFPSL